MQGNAPDEEHMDPHGECRHHINNLERENKIMRETLEYIRDCITLNAAPLSTMAAGALARLS